MEIKPCWVCEREGKLEEQIDFDGIMSAYYVQCDICLTATDFYSDEESAITEWNEGGIECD